MEEKGYGNSNPKNNYWEMEKKVEEELRVLEDTTEGLMQSSVATELSVAAQQLKEKIWETSYQTSLRRKAASLA